MGGRRWLEQVNFFLQRIQIFFLGGGGGVGGGEGGGGRGVGDWWTDRRTGPSLQV